MAVIDKITGAVSTHEQDWESIDWSLVNHEVLKLQVRIAKATEKGRWNKVKSLQWILTHSFSARCKAVKRVTENKGGKTPGVDGILLKTPGQKMRETKLLQRRDYKPLPLRRIFIPKSNGKKRPLGIPSIHDRCMQALHMFALLPVSEMYEDRYLFYSRVKGYQGKISQGAINKRLKAYAAIAHETCPDVPLNLHAHQFRHAKASHLLDDGMNVAQLSKLLGHANLSTTMVYLDITTDMEAKAMITLEDEKTRNMPRKWSKGKDNLSELFGRKRRQ